MDSVLRDFIVGSSWPATLVSMLYIGRGYLGTDPAEHPIPFQYIVWALPVFFGVANVLSNLISPPSQLTMVITGIVFGVVLSNIGTRIGEMPTRVFKFPARLAFVPMLIAPILYAFVWGIVLYNMNRLFRLD